MSSRPTVLVLGGGPDAERDVSIISSRAVAQALMDAGRFEVRYQLIDAVGPCDARSMPGDVIFPVLHGPFGEGGRMQDLLELDGRPYVGSAPRAARLAMDKLATKLAAASLGIPTPEAAVLNPSDPVCPVGLPCVVKPVHEGSSVGLAVCRTSEDWSRAVSMIRHDLGQRPDRSWMCERLVPGRELTVAMIADPGAELRAEGIVEIAPRSGLYDYEAKYQRDDTVYTVDPDLAPGVEARVKEWSASLCAHLGVRHLARVDFMLGEGGAALLEVNTMPGFTAHSLLPMVARERGLDLGALCSRLVELAISERAPAACG